MRDYRKGRVNVTDDIKRTILKLITTEKDFEKKKKHPAQWYRDEVARQLKLANEDNPSLRSYENVLKSMRMSIKADDPQEKPWNTSILNQEPYPMTPEAISAILKVWAYRIIKEFDFEDDKKPVPEVTVRQAKWISRLSSYITDTQRLSYMAKVYADSDRIDDITGGPSDHTLDDWILMGFDKRMVYVENVENRKIEFNLPKHFEHMRPALLQNIKNGLTTDAALAKANEKPWIADLYFRKYNERLPGC